MVLLRQEIGDVLRDTRRQQGRTLRQVSSVARVSLGYLSEVERGQKEASSELLASICDALELPLSSVLREVSERVAATEDVPVSAVDSAAVGAALVPDTVPDELSEELAHDLAHDLGHDLADDLAEDLVQDLAGDVTAELISDRARIARGLASAAA